MNTNTNRQQHSALSDDPLSITWQEVCARGNNHRNSTILFWTWKWKGTNMNMTWQFKWTLSMQLICDNCFATIPNQYHASPAKKCMGRGGGIHAHSIHSAHTNTGTQTQLSHNLKKEATANLTWWAWLLGIPLGTFPSVVCGLRMAFALPVWNATGRWLQHMLAWVVSRSRSDLAASPLKCTHTHTQTGPFLHQHAWILRKY